MDYTHGILWQYSNIVLVLCLQVMFLAANFPLHMAVMSVFFLCFQCCFHYITPNICALWICQYNFFRSYYFKDIANGLRVSSLFCATMMYIFHPYLPSAQLSDHVLSKYPKFQPSWIRISLLQSGHCSLAVSKVHILCYGAALDWCTWVLWEPLKASAICLKK